MKNKSLMMVFYGFLTWLIPFVAAFLFFDKTGRCSIDMDLFKSIMVVVGNLVAVYLLVRYFKKLGKSKSYLNEGLTVGLVWFAINVVLDILTLVKGFHMPLTAWANGIGVRYLAIIIVSVGMGALLQKK